MLPDPNLVSVLSVFRAVTPNGFPARESVSVERHGHRTVIVLDDGTTIDFDADELSAAAGTVGSDLPFWAGLRRAA